MCEDELDFPDLYDNICEQYQYHYKLDGFPMEYTETAAIIKDNDAIFRDIQGVILEPIETYVDVQNQKNISAQLTKLTETEAQQNMPEEVLMEIDKEPTVDPKLLNSMIKDGPRPPLLPWRDDASSSSLDDDDSSGEQMEMRISSWVNDRYHGPGAVYDSETKTKSDGPPPLISRRDYSSSDDNDSSIGIVEISSFRPNNDGYERMRTIDICDIYIYIYIYIYIKKK